MRYGRLSLTNFRGLKLDPAFTGLTGAVTTISTAVWSLDHLKYTPLERLIVCMNTAWNRWCRNQICRLAMYNNRISPIITMDITGRCNVVYKIRIPTLPPLARHKSAVKIERPMLYKQVHIKGIPMQLRVSPYRWRFGGGGGGPDITSYLRPGFTIFRGSPCRPYTGNSTGWTRLFKPEAVSMLYIYIYIYMDC